MSRNIKNICILIFNPNFNDIFAQIDRLYDLLCTVGDLQVDRDLSDGSKTLFSQSCLPRSWRTSKTKPGIRDFQELTFSEWLHAIATYCLFEGEDILKFCFFILDREKNGYIEKDEMRMLVNMLYNVDPVKGPTGNTKVAFNKLSVQQDGKIEFWEFELFNQAFPSLFFPAFRLQVGDTI